MSLCAVIDALKVENATSGIKKLLINRHTKTNVDPLCKITTEEETE